MREKLKKVPDLPGVYMFKNAKGEVVYVGKAKSLVKRLTSHFNATDPEDKSYRIVRNSVDFEFITVKNEREALVLEAELIKKHLPRFNVLLKDDKSYPYLVITNEPFPAVRLVRKKDAVSGERFGPFIPAKSARALKELVHKTFRLRKCKELTKRDKPCLQYYIDRCTAPCCGYVTKSEYAEQVRGAVSFLKGNVRAYISKLYDQIEEPAERLEFEKAAILRDQLIAIKNLYEGNSVLLGRYPNCDVFYLESLGSQFAGVRISVRNGILYRRQTTLISPFDPWEEDSLREEENPVGLDAIGTIWLKNALGEEGVELFANFESLEPCIRVKPIPLELLKLVRAELHITPLDLSRLKEEYESVFLDSLPERVDAFDVSTLQGTATVASCIVWERGKFLKNEYRRYRIRTVKGVDDYASMEEVLSRRYRRVKSGEVKKPDLVLVDGGVGQLRVAVKLRDSMGLDFRVFSIAKREEVVYTDEGEEVKTVNHPQLFRFFTSLRDEAHRFALSYGRKARNMAMTASLLEGIKGIGSKRKGLLEKLYPDLKELARVTPEELSRIGIPRKVAEEVVRRAKELEFNQVLQELPPASEGNLGER